MGNLGKFAYIIFFVACGWAAAAGCAAVAGIMIERQWDFDRRACVVENINITATHAGGTMDVQWDETYYRRSGQRCTLEREQLRVSRLPVQAGQEVTCHVNTRSPNTPTGCQVRKCGDHFLCEQDYIPWLISACVLTLLFALFTCNLPETYRKFGKV